MPYSTWGYVTHADIQDIEESMDLGCVHVELDDAPEWFTAMMFKTFGWFGSPISPVCNQPLGEHESVEVGRASGEIHACTPFYGERHEEEPDHLNDYY